MKTGRISRTAALLTLVAAVTAAGCGAIFKGSSADVRLDASPSGVSVKNGDTGASVGLPTTLRVERKGHHVLVFEKDGYTPRKVELDRSLSAGILVLDILGGLIPVVVDAATGSWFNQTPRSVEYYA